jgi:arginine/lysine/ornithine decarboxylase
LNLNGYQAADWLRENCRVDVGLSDHRRILATLSTADDEGTADRLLDAMRRLVAAAPALPAAKTVQLPNPTAFEVEPVLTLRDALFGPTRTVPIAEAVGQVCAEQITPYPRSSPANASPPS